MTAPARAGGRIIGIDPGRVKVGYAVVGPAGERIALDILPIENLIARVVADAAEAPIEAICVGHATNSAEVARLCRDRFPAIPVEIIDETNTTVEARHRYYQDHPPRGLWRLVPRGLLVPEQPLDGYAALLIVERWRVWKAGLAAD